MKSIVLVCAILLIVFAAIPCNAGQPVAFNLTTNALSSYYSQFGWKNDGKSVIQPCLTAFTGKFYGFVWGSVPFGGQTGLANELDAVVGFNDSLFDLNAGVLDISPVFQSKKEDAFLLSAKLFHAWPWHQGQNIVTPYGQIVGFIADNHANDGYYIIAGVKNDIGIDKSKLIVVSEDLSFIHDRGVFQGQNGTLVNLQLSLTYAITPVLRTILSYRLIDPVINAKDRQSGSIGGLGCSYNF